MYNNKTAILVDGGFFLKKYRGFTKHPLDPKRTALSLWNMCLQHLVQKDGQRDLYRIYYYDCLPYAGKQTNPISKKMIDYSSTQIYRFQESFLNELKKLRKVALRLGELTTNNTWNIKPDKLKNLLDGKIQMSDILEEDIYLDFRQKMVDIKIGLDIATITLKRQANQIILIAGDSDFVPASKLARTEGIDFILNPMGNNIKPHLFEHIDGLHNLYPYTNSKKNRTHP